MKPVAFSAAGQDTLERLQNCLETALAAELSNMSAAPAELLCACLGFLGTVIVDMILKGTLSTAPAKAACALMAERLADLPRPPGAVPRGQ